MTRRSRKECAIDRAITTAAARALELDDSWQNAANESKNAKYGKIRKSQDVAEFLMKQSLIALRDHDNLVKQKQLLTKEKAK